MSGQTIMRPLLLKKFTATSCIGRGLEQTLDSLIEQRSGLTRCAFETVYLNTHVDAGHFTDMRVEIHGLKRMSVK